jgi:hypothetical protein
MLLAIALDAHRAAIAGLFDVLDAGDRAAREAVDPAAEAERLEALLEGRRAELSKLQEEFREFKSRYAEAVGGPLAELAEVEQEIRRAEARMLGLDADADEDGPSHFFDPTPAPVAAFSFSPSDPSAFDTLQFSDSSSDPGGVGIQSQAWTFGDGVTAEGCCPVHQYAQDGDYTVGLTVTTADGRAGSTSQVVQVRTHDVAIVRIGVPKSAHVGQTIPVNVEVRNTRYPETVQVDLYTSSPGGAQPIQVLVHDQTVELAPGQEREVSLEGTP